MDDDEDDSEDIGEGVDDGEVGGVDDVDPPTVLPCAALPPIDEVSWFRASVSGAVP